MRSQLLGHDLVKLVESTELSIDSKERYLLAQLTGFLTWAGRYPIPVDAKSLAPKIVARVDQRLPQIELAAGTHMGVDDRRIIDQLVKRLEGLLTDQGRPE